MKEFLPENLDLNQHIEKNPPKNIKNFHKDKLATLGGIISRSKKDEDGWSEIYSKIFQQIAHNYRQYLDYYEENSIIEIKKQFQHNELVSQVRCYKFSEQYSTTIEAVEIEYQPLIKKDAKLSEIPRSVIRKYHHLSKSFNSSLSIDLDLLKDYWRFEYEINMPYYQEQKKKYQKIENTWYNTYDEKKIALKLNKPKNPILRYNRGWIYANDLVDGKYHCSLGQNSRRLTTVFTLMPKECRKFITYDGKNLCEVDISNSVPYLFLALLNPEFWERQATNQPTILPTSLQPLAPSPLILAESLHNIDNKEFKTYRDLVLSGELYHFLGPSIRSQSGYENISDKQLKKEVLSTFFSGNQFFYSLEASPKRVFAETFPGIYKFLEVLKQKSKEYLPTLLYRIESHLILDIITKRITKEYPRILVLTIHDCIASFDGEQDLIAKIASEELEKFIGYPPNFKTESLNITQLKHIKEWKARQ